MSVALTHQQAVNREKDILEEMTRLKDKKDKTVEDRQKVTDLLAEHREIHAHRLDLEHDAALAEVRSAADGSAAPETRAQVVDAPETRASAPSLGGKFRNPWDLSAIRGGQEGANELRHRAEDAIERMPHATDKVREAAVAYLDRSDEATALVLGTTSPEYMRAFSKVVRANGNTGMLDREEQAALSRAAMSTTAANGGFAIPFQLDPSVILTANGSFNEIRKIARVVTATGNKWHGISSAGVTGSWDAEGSQVSDDSPTLAQPSVEVHPGRVFIAQSFEVEADAGLAGEIAKMVAFEKDRMESVAFVTGSGAGEPFGVHTVLAATGGANVPSVTTDTFAAADVYALDAALPARFAANGSWLGHRKTYNTIRQFDTNGGSALWGHLEEGRKADLLGRPNYVGEAMPSAITASAENRILIFGDFQNYVIADRLGATLSYIPHLFGADGRPTGQSGWFAHFRVGGNVVNTGAFKVLNVT